MNESHDDGLDIENRLAELWSSESPAADQMQARKGQLVGQYKIRALLGSGSFGLVYLADDTKNKCPVALKLPRLEVLLDEEKRKRFRVEATIIQQLDHPGIVRIQQSGVDDSLPYIACDWCSGPDLAAYLEEFDLAEQGVPKWQESVRLMIQVAQALHFAHEQGITHRDIKPANILLDRPVEDDDSKHGLDRFNPRITDFGLARLSDPVATSTRTGVIMGTPAYMSPERVIAGLAAEPAALQHDDSVAADIYSLGAVLFELLSGKPPAGADSWLELIRNEKSTSTSLLNWPRDIPAPLKQVVNCCLRRNPETRYRSAADFESDLTRLLDGKAPLGQPIGMGQGLKLWFAARDWATVAGWFAIISQTIVAIWLIVGDIVKISFGLLSSSQYFNLLPQLITIACTSSLSVILCGWLCTRRFRWAPFLGVALAIWNLRGPLLALFGEPQIFEEIYSANSPYLSFQVHLVIAIVSGCHLLLFGCAAIESSTSAKGIRR